MRILYITDLAAVGSGYMSLSLPICIRLSQHHDVKVIGLGNHGEQHPFPFTIYPAQDMAMVMRTAQFLYSAWQYDVMIVALDIPVQEGMLRHMPNRPFKYVGLFPVEADPLCLSWSMVCMSMDKQFVISEFGKKELQKRFIESAEHAEIGIDTQSWVVPSLEEKSKLRAAFGIEDDEFVVLTVADNQERKNLWLNFKAFSQFAKDRPRSRYILVTREYSPAGWKLRDMAFDPMSIGEEASNEQGYNISDKLMIFERGLPFAELWRLYAMSDAFLLLSKAEGLGLPLMEAMSVGIPCVGTDCTGISELLGDGRGVLIEPEYVYIDPFGNGRRYLAKPELAAEALEVLASNPSLSAEITNKARFYMENRIWDRTVEPILNYLEEITHGQEEGQSQETNAGNAAL
jgi:glycosyltransferase involved in cell wall biosynthesis